MSRKQRSPPDSLLSGGWIFTRKANCPCRIRPSTSSISPPSSACSATRHGSASSPISPATKASRSACGQFLDLGSKTNLSYHLAKLREAGVTRTEVSGTSRLISLRRDDLDRRFPGLLDSILASAKELPLRIELAG